MWWNRSKASHSTRIGKGLLAGLAGGIAGSLAMSFFQRQIPQSAFAELLGESESDGSSGGGSDEPATVRAAEGISETVLDHELEDDEKEWAGPAVHYGVGAVGGASYGVIAEEWSPVTAGAGLPFGMAFWLGSDEVAVPAVGLSGPPWEHPLSVHVYSLASHLVYGFTTEITRRTLRRLL